MKQCLKYNYDIKSSIRTINILLSILIFLSSCAGPLQTTKQPDIPIDKDNKITKYETLAHEKYSGDLLYIPNSNNTYMLCVSNNKPTNENPFPNFSYFIFDMKSEEILFEDTQENGNVNWKNNEQIMIHTFPGQMKSENDRPIVYIYDIKKNKKFIDEIIKDK
jgi:hypothetical protein